MGFGLTSCALSFALALGANEKVALEINFDGPAKATESWKSGPKGKIRIADESSDSTGSNAKRHLSIDAQPQSGIETRDSVTMPDFTRCSDIEFRIRTESATPSEPSIVEVQFYTPDFGRFWRKVEVRSSEFETMRLPLRWFRTGDGATPRWSEVSSFGFWFRSGGKIAIDDVRIIGGDAGAAELTPDAIAKAAFGADATVSRFARGPFVILSDDSEIAGNAILDALVAMEASVHRDFPKGEKPWHPVVLLVFAHDADYRAFWPRFAAEFGGVGAAPTSSGFTAMSVATSSAGDVPVRPVFVHEAAHALLEQVLRIGHSQDWVQEGLAVRYQSEFMQEDLGATMRKRLKEDPERATRLARLTDGTKIYGPMYAYAGSFIEWAFADAERTAGLRSAINAMVKARSAKLEPHAKPCFGVSLDELETRWLEWAKTRYAEPARANEK